MTEPVPCESCLAPTPEGARFCPECVINRHCQPLRTPEEWRKIQNRKSDDKSTLLAYLQLCVRDEDWHGVWDTAIMLEVLAAKEKSPCTTPSAPCSGS